MVSYLADVWRCRYFWLSLVKMDLRTRYRRSVLGLGWSLLHPIAMTAVLCFVFHRIFQVPSKDYAPSVMAGLAFWNYLTSATQSGCICFFQAESYIRQYPSPLAIFPLRTALGSGIHFLIALVVAIAIAGFTVGFPGGPVVLLSLLPTLLLLFAFGWAMALLAGISNVLFQDTEHLTTVGFQILFYATPIIYTAKIVRENGLTWIMRLNPLVAFLNLLRDPIIAGQWPHWTDYAMASTTVATTAGVATFLLWKLQRRFVFYL